MTIAVLLLSGALWAADECESLTVWMEATPREVTWGDLVFYRIVTRNDGPRAISVASFSREAGNLLLEIMHRRDYTMFWLAEGAGSGMSVTSDLRPGESRTVCYEAVALPSLRECDASFWNPRTWQDGEYTFLMHLRVGKSLFLRHFGADVTIRARDAEERFRLMTLWQEGKAADRFGLPFKFDFDRPGPFDIAGAPSDWSNPEKLATLEETLSPGTLRDMVRATRLMQGIYDASTPAGKLRATDAFCEWLDQLPPIQRAWLAMEHVNWKIRDPDGRLGTFPLDFRDKLIERLPEEFRGEKFRDRYREENAQARRNFK